jgi:DNA-binding protein HU-beta
MSTVTDRDAGRVSKREFQQRFARRAGVSLRTATTVYDAMIDELKELVAAGNRVTLTGFGKFYMQEHKGHAVHYKSEDSTGRVEDYSVLKFSATRTLNKRVSGKGGKADEDDE